MSVRKQLPIALTIAGSDSGGGAGIHQFVRIGEYTMVGGCCAIGQDIPPFTFAAGGYRAHLYGLNTIGLQRHGFSADRIASLKKAFDLLFRAGHRTASALGRGLYEYRATVTDANLALGFSPDLRDYGVGAQILRDLGVAKMRLLGSPRRMPSMTGYGLEVTGFVAA